MAKTTVPAKYEVLIPREIRERVAVRPGQVYEVIAKGGVISLVPDEPISAMRGFVRTLRTNGFREKKDRF